MSSSSNNNTPSPTHENGTRSAPPPSSSTSAPRSTPLINNPVYVPPHDRVHENRCLAWFLDLITSDRCQKCDQRIFVGQRVNACRCEANGGNVYCIKCWVEVRKDKLANATAYSPCENPAHTNKILWKYKLPLLIRHSPAFRMRSIPGAIPERRQLHPCVFTGLLLSYFMMIVFYMVMFASYSDPQNLIPTCTYIILCYVIDSMLWLRYANDWVRIFHAGLSYLVVPISLLLFIKLNQLYLNYSILIATGIGYLVSYLIDRISNQWFLESLVKTRAAGEVSAELAAVYSQPRWDPVPKDPPADDGTILHLSTNNKTGPLHKKTATFSVGEEEEGHDHDPLI